MQSEMVAGGHAGGVLFLLVPAALMLFTFPQEVIRLLFGNAYVSGALAMQILVLGILFLAVGLINQAVLLGTGRPKEVTIIVLIAAAFNGILNIIFIPVYGIIGAAASTTLSYLIIFLLTTHRIRGFVPLFDLFKLLVRFLTLSIVFVSVIFFFKTTLQLHPLAEAAISLAAAGTIYVLGARLLRIVSYRDIRNFIKVVKG